MHDDEEDRGAAGLVRRRVLGRGGAGDVDARRGPDLQALAAALARHSLQVRVREYRVVCERGERQIR